MIIETIMRIYKDIKTTFQNRDNFFDCPDIFKIILSFCNFHDELVLICIDVEIYINNPYDFNDIPKRYLKNCQIIF